MRINNDRIEKYRIATGRFASDFSYGNNGAFTIRHKYTVLFVIASDGGGWEHASVHAEKDGKPRTPTWDDMCFIKDLFWDEEELVLQYHPPRSEYINAHENVLHLWKPIGVEIPLPPRIFV